MKTEAKSATEGITREDSTAVKLSCVQKIGYGLGEAGSTLSFTLIGSYLTVFYSDVVGLAPAVISVIMLVARIWQAICDPVFGGIAENTKSKFGRYRPYILFGAPLLAVFNCLTFLNINISGGAKAFWCILTYIICCTAYSVANGAVTCVVNSLTSINTERVSANAYKGAIGSLFGIIVSAVTMPLIMKFGNGNVNSSRGYFLTALIFSVASLPCFYLCFKATREVIGGGQQSGGKKENPVLMILHSFKNAFKDWNVACLMIAMVLYLVGIFGRIGVMVYYFIYILGEPMGMAAFGSAMTLGMFVVNLYAPVLLNKIDKKYVGVLACVMQSACCIAFFFMGEAKVSSTLIAVVGFVYGATNLVTLTSVALCGELIDDNWIRTGKRSDGVIVTAISFSTKVANAIGGAVGIVILGAVGFVANSEMTASTLTKMNGVINFGPAVCFILAIIPFLMIRMTNKKGRENEEKIKVMTSLN